MQRAYYWSDIDAFLNKSQNEVLGEIVRNNEFALEQEQRNAWEYEIALLQCCLEGIPDGSIALEYTVPRIGNRIDAVLFYHGVIYPVEFKVGETLYPKHAIEQVIDYALDLKYFHKESHNKKIIPILVCTKAPNYNNEIKSDEDGIYKVIRANEKTLRSELEHLTRTIVGDLFIFEHWVNSAYMPTPTIIEAAQALYRGHDVKEISRSDSEAYNLSLTAEAINEIIDESKLNKQKSICFITGVPGAGKTLAGLNIANERHNYDESEHAVFLSGNGPLVFVLREALARDENRRSGRNISKGAAMKKAEAFIQNIHQFRNDALDRSGPPIEKVAVFDEAQRAWTKEQTAKFMAKRKHSNWDMSEPEFLISIMDRHKDWAVIVCLVGGGQEINTGEAGLPEWFCALRRCYPEWKVFVSNQISDNEYLHNSTLEEMLSGLSYQIVEKLHLAVSLRSFRSERVASLVKALLEIDIAAAQQLYSELEANYPILLTRNLKAARDWVRSKARGSERYGMVASSGAKRLRSSGIWVQSSIRAENWFLNSKEDVRSSYFLEDVATEFEIQGLEIDWVIVAWDADFRVENDEFATYCFSGANWRKVGVGDKRRYIKNAYRVLLTRARQGLVIFIPEGDDNDTTRQKRFYDSTYKYLKETGIQEIY